MEELAREEKEEGAGDTGHCGSLWTDEGLRKFVLGSLPSQKLGNDVIPEHDRVRG